MSDPRIDGFYISRADPKDVATPTAVYNGMVLYDLHEGGSRGDVIFRHRFNTVETFQKRYK